MTLSSEKLEPLILAGANWPLLEYLIDRFNRPGLEGTVLLRRTPFNKQLQLCLLGECCGTPMSPLSEAFDDLLICEAAEKEHLAGVVSRFLLKVKELHAKRCSQTLGESLRDTSCRDGHDRKFA